MVVWKMEHDWKGTKAEEEAACVHENTRIVFFSRDGQGSRK